MKAKKIITDEILLSRESVNVDPTDPRVPEIIEEMIATANVNKARCVGLAANQIGHLVRIFIIRAQPTPGVTMWYPIINPEVTSRSPERKKGLEWCLSRPNQPAIRVKRHKGIVLRYTALNEKGEPEEVQDKFIGFNARVVQHEMDHFKGKLI